MILRAHKPQLAKNRGVHQEGLLADGEVAQEILERFQRMSEPFGTKIDIKDGIGNIQLGLTRDR